MNTIGIHFLLDHPLLLALSVGLILLLVFLERARRLPKTVAPEGGQGPVTRMSDGSELAAPAIKTHAGQAPWVTRLFTHLDIIQGYTPATTPEDPKQLRAFAARAMLGKKPDALPCLESTKSMYAPPKPMHDISLANGQLLLVSKRLKTLLQAANEGTCAFYPTLVYDAAEKTLLSEDHSYWAIGARKETLEVDLTPGLKPVTSNENSSAYGTFHPPVVITDGLIRVSPDCLDGPQVWVESRLRSTVFFSDGFVQILKQNKLDNLFGLKRCTMG